MDDRPGYPFSRAGALRTVRRYDADGRIVGGRLLEIPAEEEQGFDAALAEAFADPRVVLAHVRAVEYGCFHFEVRAGFDGGTPGTGLSGRMVP